ncbi:MAG: acetyl-CoA decarbonylase/synthase complex subunit delta [Armatimonadota bacterium]|nr:MAG: acetyl-CoA decarbonylase/synthase complex subunit delta [Armatimonadota bacterium]
MSFEVPVEKWSTAVSTITLGATADNGGTRTSTVTLGGAATLPFLHFEGQIPNRPVVAMEVLDTQPKEWPEALAKPFGNVLGDPAAWAQKCVEEFGAEAICLRLTSAHPDNEDTGPDHAAEVVKKVLGAVGVPLIIWGCGDDAKDNEVIPRASEAAAGENCALGTAREDNYKTITAACLADGHKLITEAPIDINIAKQVNILVSDMGLSTDRIIMYQATGGLGYGMEYAYSIMERARLAALGGDKMLSMPMLAVVGSEAWRAKEAKAPDAEGAQWGPQAKRGPIWEAVTANCFLHGGVDTVIMWHPEAVQLVKQAIDKLMQH